MYWSPGSGDQYTEFTYNEVKIPILSTFSNNDIVCVNIKYELTLRIQALIWSPLIWKRGRERERERERERKTLFPY